MVSLVDPTAAAFLYAESRSMPMHVGGLQLFEPPADAGDDYATTLYESLRDTAELNPLFLQHPKRSLTSAGQWTWERDENFDVDHHVRHSALPRPGRVRELLDLCSRLHGTRLALERPLWESHIIEGLADGRVAMYTKVHHALVDGVSAMRLMASTLSTDPDERGLPAPWAVRPQRPGRERRPSAEASGHGLVELPASALRSALEISTDAAGLPGSLVRTVSRSLRHETSPLSLYTPRTMFNQTITGARRFAAQEWPLDRIRAVGEATGTTLNDVVLAMCSGAMRAYLLELDELPDTSMVAMVPVSLHTRKGTDRRDPAAGGNAIGVVMVQLGTHLADPGDRLEAIHHSMDSGKEALASMTPMQILAMTGLGMAPALFVPALRLQKVLRPAFNLIMSNVPGPRETQYFNGAKMVGMYPLSIPMHGMGLNITCASYADQLGFGLTGCRRTVPHLQRMLTFLDDELAALEKAAGL